MRTIIKIAVVSVLALFTIVGVVSISKAEEIMDGHILKWYGFKSNNENNASERPRLFYSQEAANKIIMEGEIINTGSNDNYHSFSVIYNNKLFYCRQDIGTTICNSATENE